MNIVAFSHSPLSWRPLLPVVCELAGRGHEITIQTTRAEWRGMPTFQMAFRPRFVIGINKAVLDWVSRLDGFEKEWKEAQASIHYQRHFVPEEYDCAVATTKDLKRLKCLELDINGNMQTFAIGCQHWPVVLRDNFDPQTATYLNRYADGMPAAFVRGHPFEMAHKLSTLLPGRRAVPCGFPHLDRLQAGSDMDHMRWSDRLHLIHHGGYRGLSGHEWMLSILRVANTAGYLPSVSPHGIHGWGYGAQDLQRVINRAGVPCLILRAGWWPTVDDCGVILTTGSATIYDLWSLGKRNVLVLDYLGGGRSRPFQMFPDILVKSEAELAERLRAGWVTATAPLTLEVIEAFAKTHTGHGAEIAADVVEGKR